MIKIDSLLLNKRWGEFKVSSNKGGDGILGEVTLQSNSQYISLQQMYGGELDFLFRNVSSMKDYTGGYNRYKSLQDLGSSSAMDQFITSLRML